MLFNINLDFISQILLTTWLCIQVLMNVVSYKPGTYLWGLGRGVTRFFSQETFRPLQLEIGDTCLQTKYSEVIKD